MTDHPLRLAAGSHEKGSGKGCVMNVVSWIAGDTTITDTPDCADPFLTSIAQTVNDTICNHRDRDLLCAECSQVVLDLGNRTIGTAGVATKAHYVELAIWSARSAGPSERRLRLLEATEEWMERESHAKWNELTLGMLGTLDFFHDRADRSTLLAARCAVDPSGLPAHFAFEAVLHAGTGVLAAFDKWFEVTGHVATPAPAETLHTAWAELVQ